MMDPETHWCFQEDLTLDECEDSFLTIERLRDTDGSTSSRWRRSGYLGRRSSRIAEALLRAIGTASSHASHRCSHRAK